ncbi:MAG: HAD family hydrolase [Candidatus Omnitrophica bacterium]|jgi:D-glycero-D-manno-heptose 1,7-bisphosphate phosphatase|nr:HAD family hydrolase [Candidatus Omnitrophota bacterium]
MAVKGGKTDILKAVRKGKIGIMKRIVFLDRDGVINVNPVYRDYVKRPSEFKFLPGSRRAVKLLNEAGFLVMIISNQTGVGKGLYTGEDLKRITEKMTKGFAKSGARLDKICYCIHHPDAGCLCRKPKTGMLKKAVAGIAFDRKNSYFIGDTERDMLAGRAFGLKTIAVLSGYCSKKDIKDWSINPDFVSRNLYSSVKDIILAERKLLRCLCRCHK